MNLAIQDSPLNTDHTCRQLETQQLTTFNRATNKKTKHVKHGETITIGEVQGKGYISNLWLTFPNWFWGHWAPDTVAQQSLLKTCILRIYWDDAERPAIEAPIGDFFGIGLCRVANFASEFFGMSSGGFFCKFPMRFQKGFRITVENMDAEADTEIFMNVVYQLDEDMPADTPYFHAQFNTGENPGPAIMPIAQFEGQGQYVGCCVSMQGQQKCYLSYLEAPEFIYVDDDWDQARIVGTGLEDYFMGGWYFREGLFTGPHHGLTIKDVIHASVAMYRIHDTDAIHFNQRFRMEFQNMWEIDRLQPFMYSSVAYAMLNNAKGQGKPLPPRDELLCWYRVRDIDHSWDGQ